MTTQTTRRIVTAAFVAAIALCGALVAQDTIQAEEGAAITVGTYEPQEAAQKTGLNNQITQAMSGLQERMMAAQQQGNQQEMQKIQAEAQQIQQDVVEDFQSRMKAAMPAVAKATGTDIIAIRVSYAAEGIETKDVTDELIKEMTGTAPAGAGSELFEQ